MPLNLDRRFYLLLDLGGAFHLLPSQSQSQELTHSIFTHTNVKALNGRLARTVSLKHIPQLDGTMFSCFEMPLSIHYTLNPNIPMFDFRLLQKRGYDKGVDRAIKNKNTRPLKIPKNIKYDAEKFPYKPAIIELIWIIRNLNVDTQDIYPMDSEPEGYFPPIDFDKLESGEQEYRFYHLNEFKNGQRGIPVLIDHSKKLFWNMQKMWPALNVKDDSIGVMIADFRDISLYPDTANPTNRRVPMLISTLGGAKLCKECNHFVNAYRFRADGPWGRYADIVGMDSYGIRNPRDWFSRARLKQELSQFLDPDFLEQTLPQAPGPSHSPKFYREE
jgi:hypothetical protein